MCIASFGFYRMASYSRVACSTILRSSVLRTRETVSLPPLGIQYKVNGRLAIDPHSGNFRRLCLLVVDT